MNPPLEASTVDGPAGRLSVYSTPKPPTDQLPVVLLHGNSMVATSWSRIVALLPDSRQYVCPEFRGHGTSEPGNSYGAEQYADDVLAVLDALGVRRAHLAGGLFGGMVACVLAARAPERFVSLIAVGSALSVDIDPAQAVEMMREMGVRAFHEWQMPQALPPGSDPALLPELIDGASNGRSFETVSAATFAAFSADVTSWARQVSCPSLVINGEFDPACTPAYGQQMAAELGGSAVVMSGVGHAPMLEAPAELAALMSEHFSAHEPLPAGTPA